MKASTQAKMIAAMEIWLDERWSIFEFACEKHGILESERATTPDFIYYKGAVEMLQYCGFSWKRNEEGKHRVFFNYN